MSLKARDSIHIKLRILALKNYKKMIKQWEKMEGEILNLVLRGNLNKRLNVLILSLLQG